MRRVTFAPDPEMPSLPLHRAVSWPPSRSASYPSYTSASVATQTDQVHISDAIDDNPFSFFLTSPSPDDEIFSFENGFADDDAAFFSDEDFELDAGIETPESRSPVREVSPSSLQRERLTMSPIIVVHGDGQHGDDGHAIEEEEEDYEFDIAMPMSLKDFSMGHKLTRQKRRENAVQDGLGLSGLGLGLHIPPPPAATRPQRSTIFTPLPTPTQLDLNNTTTTSSSRGRPTTKIRNIPTRDLGRRPRLSRSGGGRHKRNWSWSGPSPEMWTIEEDHEFEVRAERGGEIMKGCLLNGGSEGEQRSRPIDIPRVVKRVHWAC